MPGPAPLAALAVAAHGLPLRGAIADHGSPAEAAQPTLAELGLFADFDDQDA